MCVYLRTKCQVSSIILTSFRQEVSGGGGGGGGGGDNSLLQNKPLKSTPRLELNLDCQYSILLGIYQVAFK